jgi:hypothetical protein
MFAACASLVQKSGEALEGKTFAVKTAALYQSEGKRSSRRFEMRELRLKNGESVLEFSDSSVPGLVLRAGLPHEDGVIDLIEADFLASHLSGWNQFTLELIGSASLQKTTDGVVLLFPAPAERVQISTGRIRLKSSRISGADALKNLRNRRERILAVVEWMRERPDITAFNKQQEFEDYWKRILFPELVSQGKRPPEYSKENAEWNNDGGIKWNKTYTEFLLPEWLWELRNSGALLRDFEEAVAWFYLEYQWEQISTAFDGINLKKIKGD